VQKLGGVVCNYALRAAIAAYNARVSTAAQTDWERVVLLFEGLRLEIFPRFALWLWPPLLLSSVSFDFAAPSTSSGSG
jgi:hypothetical protein